MHTTLITGANRGLGLEFTKQYATAGWRVHACVRDTSGGALEPVAAAAGGRVSVHALDVTDHAAVDALATRLGGEAIDVLLNVAGVISRASAAGGGFAVQRFGESDYEDWMQTLRVNLFGPMKMAEAFVGHVAASRQKKIVTMSSIVGSMARNQSGGMYGYRSSKAAVNAVMKSMAIDLKKRGIVALALHPGWARTDMGGSRAPIEPGDSVTGMIRVIERAGPGDSGRFLQYDGAELPW